MIGDLAFKNYNNLHKNDILKDSQLAINHI